MGRLKAAPSRLTPAPPRLGAAPDPRPGAAPRTTQVRAKGNPLRHLYALKPWRDLRQVILARDGWMCQGCAVPHLLIGTYPAPHSPVIDHIVPHRGNPVLFWDETNLQLVCKSYH